MKRLLLAIAFLGYLLPVLSWADCNGQFPTGTVCGNVSGVQKPPGPLTLSQVGFEAPVIPGGRVSLATVPLTTSDIVGATTAYYVPDGNNEVPIWNGTQFINTNILGVLSQATTDATKSPAAVAANKIYFIVVWNDNGTVRATRTFPWSSDTVVGTGAGSAELSTANFGVPVNKWAITNGPAAGFGTVVGAVRSDGTSQLTDSLAFRWVSNVYNAMPRQMAVIDPTFTWVYTTATWRQCNFAIAGTANQLDILQALAGGMVEAFITGSISNTNASVATQVSIGLNTASAPLANVMQSPGYSQVANIPTPVGAFWRGFTGQGRNILTCMEQSAATGTTNWYGTALGVTQGIHGWVIN